MKKALLKLTFGLFLTAITVGSFAQRAKVGYIRPNDRSGVNVFETSKTDSVKFNGVDVRVGGNFNQSFQNLKHSNTPFSATVAPVPPATVSTVYTNPLTPLTNGFNTASANLNIDVALADGISLNLVTYLSTRHHNETWVKGGYIQFEKLPFLNSSVIDQIMEFTTIRAGHMEINYGDAHFRRSDAGNTFFNPFMESYLLDAFTTEIGGDIMFRSNGAFLLGGITGGEIKGDVTEPTVTASDDKAKRSPSFIGKIGFDQQLNEDLRVRVSASGYYTASSASNTLFSGDRSGSNYFLVMENSNDTKATLASGRMNPGFSDKVQSMMGNVFVKYSGLEFFGTYEAAKGRARTELSERKVNQFAADLLYRFGNKENFYVGARYNKFSGEIPTLSTYATKVTKVMTQDVNVDRIAAAAGWYITPNMLVKGEYVMQNYNDYYASESQAGGQFKGFMIAATVAF